MYTYPNAKSIQSLYTVWKNYNDPSFKNKKNDPNYVLAEPWGLRVQHVPYGQTKAVS